MTAFTTAKNYVEAKRAYTNLQKNLEEAKARSKRTEMAMNSVFGGGNPLTPAQMESIATAIVVGGNWQPRNEGDGRNSPPGIVPVDGQPSRAVECVTQVLQEMGPLNCRGILNALASKGWVLNSSKPRGYIHYILSQHSGGRGDDLFERGPKPGLFQAKGFMAPPATQPKRVNDPLKLPSRDEITSYLLTMPGPQCLKDILAGLNVPYKESRSKKLWAILDGEIKAVRSQDPAEVALKGRYAKTYWALPLPPADLDSNPFLDTPPEDS